MPEPESIDGVRYHAVDAAYFEKRGLRKYAGVWSLWALGVGAVISGDFFGWNFGLAAGGLISLFLNPEYRPGVWGCAIWFLIGTAYFGLYGRRHLVKSPEEAFAIGHRSKSGATVPGIAD